ncbi:hypothetical protein AVEN_145870-1 [Araneus ventricosus]|uniref:Uncharacterized protein n=1 Tax=Araneus ventricosus TaxID=182803 RepID=A0A4Y2CEZ8_ARAVE|nr:hypothetical protein AVEN_145870-1 [Araneus ventricosus]
MKTRHDSRATEHHFEEGDLVWMYNPKRRRGLSPKLQQNWEGPHIVKKLNDVVHRAQRSSMWSSIDSILRSEWITEFRMNHGALSIILKSLF